MVVSNPTASPVSAPAGQPLAIRLSKNISARRKTLGLTQAQLAERLGVDTETLSRFERGKHLPSLERLEQLAGLLLTTMADLLAEERPKADDEVSMLSAWLTPLSPQDRDFAKGVLKQCCDYLSCRQPAQPAVAETTEADILPMVSHPVASSSPNSVAEAKPKKLKSKSAPKATLKAKPSAILPPEEKLLAGGDSAIKAPKSSRSPVFRLGGSLQQVDAEFEISVLADNLDEVMTLMDAKKLIGLTEQGNRQYTVEVGTAYKLYSARPDLKEAVLARYPKAETLRMAGAKEELRDIRDTKENPVRLTPVPPNKPWKSPESWDAKIEKVDEPDSDEDFEAEVNEPKLVEAINTKQHQSPKADSVGRADSERGSPWSKEDVLDWFGDRGVFMEPECLKKWHWASGTLWFVIKGVRGSNVQNTAAHCADMTMTHREDGSPILGYELYKTVPFKESPLAKSTAK